MARVSETSDHDPREGAPEGKQIEEAQRQYVEGRLDRDELEEAIEKAMTGNGPETGSAAEAAEDSDFESSGHETRGRR